jgi:hypothetical protein
MALRGSAGGEGRGVAVRGAVGRDAAGGAACSGRRGSTGGEGAAWGERRGAARRR